MRTVYIVSDNHHKTDAAIRLLNNHSRRASMNLVPITSPDKLRDKPHGLTAVLVQPIFDKTLQVDFEEVLRMRGAVWGECDCSGGFILGEQL